MSLRVTDGGKVGVWGSCPHSATGPLVSPSGLSRGRRSGLFFPGF